MELLLFMRLAPGSASIADSQSLLFSLVYMLGGTYSDKPGILPMQSFDEKSPCESPYDNLTVFFIEPLITQQEATARKSTFKKV